MSVHHPRWWVLSRKYFIFGLGVMTGVIRKRAQDKAHAASRNAGSVVPHLDIRGRDGAMAVITAASASRRRACLAFLILLARIPAVPQLRSPREVQSAHPWALIARWHSA